MQPLNRNTTAHKELYPERILQFGGGNFLRGFVDWIIDTYNEKTNARLGILVVKPTPRGDYENWRQQEGLFHVLTKGISGGELINSSRLVRSVSRIVHPYHEWEQFLESANNPSLNYIISNTTELGIRFSADDQLSDAPPAEFPAKLLRWLMRRYEHFAGAQEAGCVIIPTELLVDNGRLLKEILLQYAEAWSLDSAFISWLETANTFCNTLVDRIIPGIKGEERVEAWEQVGYTDEMITQGEPYHFWAIEAPSAVREALPLGKSGLDIIYCDDIMPYRSRKVRILNGAHTVMVPVGYLSGLETVQEAVEDELVGAYIQEVIFQEILPTLSLPEEELRAFAEAVLDRFRNPFIRHELISIALNSVSKYKARILPTLLDYYAENKTLPQRLVFALAAMSCFYRGNFQGKSIPLKDSPAAIERFQQAWKTHSQSEQTNYDALAKEILGWQEEWGQNLNLIPEFTDVLSKQISTIQAKGMPAALRQIIQL